MNGVVRQYCLAKSLIFGAIVFSIVSRAEPPIQMKIPDLADDVKNAAHRLSENLKANTQQKQEEVVSRAIPASFPKYEIGADGYLDQNGKLIPFKSKDERNQYHLHVVNSYMSEISTSIGKPDFALKVWQAGNSIARLQRQNNLYLTHQEKTNLLELLREQIKKWCEFHLKKEWNIARCEKTLEPSLQGLNAYFWHKAADKMRKTPGFHEYTPENIDKFIQQVEFLDHNSEANLLIRDAVHATEYVKKLAFIDSNESRSTGTAYNTANFVVGSTDFKGKAYNNEISRNFLHGAVTNEYAHRVVNAIGQPHMEQAVWHNVNAVARLRRNNNIYLREKGVNLKDKTDYHLAQNLKKWCEQQAFSFAEEKAICLRYYEQMRGLLDELNELSWTRYDVKQLDNEARDHLMKKYAYRFEGVAPGSPEFEDRFVDVMIQEEARNPNSRVNEILRLIGKPGQNDPSIMKWFYNHGYKPDPAHTLAKLTDTKSLSEPSFVWEIKKMIADKNYVTPYFKTSKPIKKFIGGRSALVQIPLSPKSNNVGPCGSFHYEPGADANDAYAAPITACVFTALLQEWRRAYPPANNQAYADSAYRVSWGDISHKDAMYFNDHESHTHGTCIDVRPFRKNGFVNAGLSYSYGKGAAYSPDITQKFINMAKSMGAEPIYFNDDKLHNRSYCGGHDNHLHLCFPNNKKTRDVCGNFKVDTNVCPSLGT